ncbi:EamA family transporter [Helicobacter monodelphidis]|uniref:DMT family transporter n=1 Tax=Helicobacter sp. 15-1451 TaxID=2004995 RepID=UPI000DCE4289|nr:DMT family transporter [Helicobacter sp. 15-1451]RAX57825.1 EamA family transporter [Helicobacter sp. 15-1451]
MLKIIKHNLGIYFMILACLDFALLGVCVKLLGEELPSIEVAFFRNFFATLFLIYLFFKAKKRFQQKFQQNKSQIGLLIFRGIAGVLALYLFFYNIQHITLVGAFAFHKSSPIFITLIAFLIFRENIGWRGFLGISIAFLGVLFISQPWMLNIEVGFRELLLGLACGFFSALSLLSARKLKASFSTEIIALGFMIVGSIIPLISMFIGEFYAPKELDFLIAKFQFPSLKAWILVLIMGALSAIYQIHITKSFGVAKKAAIVAGVSYLDVVFSLILGIFLGDALPNFLVILGVCGVIFGGVMVIYRHR